MIGTLNALVDLVEQRTDDEIDVTAFAREHGTTEYHLRRTFSSLRRIRNWVDADQLHSRILASTAVGSGSREAAAWAGRSASPGRRAAAGLTSSLETGASFLRMGLSGVVA